MINKDILLCNVSIAFNSKPLSSNNFNMPRWCKLNKMVSRISQTHNSSEVKSNQMAQLHNLLL